jgi:hypothetical protein
MVLLENPSRSHWGKPRYKEIKRGLAKPIEDYLGRTNM